MLKSFQLVILSLILLFPVGIRAAERPESGNDSTKPASTWDSLHWSIGPLNLNAPFQQVYAVSLYDFIGNKPLVGGETPVAKLWKVTGNIGAVTSLEGHGNPFISGQFDLPNPLQQSVWLRDLRLGGWGGYSFKEGRAMVGLKAAIALWD